MRRRLPWARDNGDVVLWVVKTRVEDRRAINSLDFGGKVSQVWATLSLRGLVDFQDEMLRRQMNPRV